MGLRCIKRQATCPSLQYNTKSIELFGGCDCTVYTPTGRGSSKPLYQATFVSVDSIAVHVWQQIINHGAEVWALEGALGASRGHSSVEVSDIPKWDWIT